MYLYIPSYCYQNTHNMLTSIFISHVVVVVVVAPGSRCRKPDGPQVSGSLGRALPEISCGGYIEGHSVLC